ncbi:MAG: hypothetical protein RMI99_05215 [Nitrososphaerota archaeon]|nr:hypothetical protein [Nitrososphaerota archaeon]
MVYIVVSFIPWIVYWILCGLGFRLGVLLSFIISIILVMPQRMWKSYNLMDLSSIVYFSLASIGTFIFNLDFFVQYSGPAGYFALFLMAAFSIAIKQPLRLKFLGKTGLKFIGGRNPSSSSIILSQLFGCSYS